MCANKKTVLGGRVLGILISLAFLMSGFMKFSGKPEVTEGMAHLGWPLTALPLLGILELGSVILYLIPATSFLGAILLTGYLGGAIATHLRLGEPVFAQVAFGIIVWLALGLQESRLRALLPLRRSSPPNA